ncbi:O-antigen polymerase [Mucilaginibacter phyllosphaerae]|uniref:Oligosaccharide repeat unit polymerase n=1 Tax=Mucilaginibacter phyllosphaerae TaxID=1812349 RepID=A0A4Y8A9E4_9SPHI|nr:O-antigen polymerase [Mucilaginibacter phyllosphaerae]MBB3969704.1 oligosaccharide repeat unit polymerase [Mucilaginibacter phyllosphaerae]TEW65087.1 oligosaccharide repeat unit polymerase [Mucilaginibacter phyllosphaerae]GGH18054.1 hypothetical protein GCM10007352_28530 [Mucilaginibacter phyllosphaerae]
MKDFDAIAGVVRFNWVLFILNLILIVHFFSSWYLSYKKTGWKIDYWNFTMFLVYFVPFLLMYPFAGSLLNVIAVGDNIDAIQGYISQAYLISFAGYVSVFIGKFLFDRYLLSNVINYCFIFPFELSITRLYISIVKSKICCIITFLLFCLALFFVLLLALKSGQILNPRGYFQSDTSVRPIYNFMLVLSAVIAQIFIARIFVYNQLSDKVIFGVYLLLSMFIGSRGAIVYPIIQLYTYYLFLKKQGKVNLTKLIFLGLFMLFFVIYLGSVRDGDTSVMNTLAKMSMMTFYGNSFSDLRDFSWVLSAWDGIYLNGKTYLSAFISFVPSAISSFRTQWGIGKVTAVLAGFDPLEHPGLRPGMFGESFLNFGIAGVMFIGTILGYSYRYIDYKIKKAANNKDFIIAFSAPMSCIFISNLPITPGFFNLYFMLLIFLLLFFIKALLYIFIKKDVSIKA